MLRINPSPAVALTTIALEGKLMAPWLPELRLAVDSARAEGAVRLNLSGLSFIDPAGVEALKSLRDVGVDLTGASRFIQELLTADGQRA
jgi:anti-anti-sigma regulatory factor